MTIPPFPFLPASPEERLRLTQYGELCARMAVERSKARQTGWERGGKRHVLDTYAKLHEGKIGMHWLWAAIERIVWAGESEASTMEDFGYVPEAAVRTRYAGRPPKIMADAAIDAARNAKHSTDGETE